MWTRRVSAGEKGSAAARPLGISTGHRAPRRGPMGAAKFSPPVPGCMLVLGTRGLLADPRGELADLLVPALALLHVLANLVHGEYDRGVVATTESLTDLGK